MVEKFKTVLRIIQERGEVRLFAIFKMDEFTDKWSVIFSAPWALEENRAEVFNYLKEVISVNLTEEEKVNIARIGIFSKDDHATQAFLQFQADTQIKEDTKVNGFMIHEGYILASNRNI